MDIHQQVDATAVPAVPPRFNPVDWIARFRAAGGSISASASEVDVSAKLGSAAAAMLQGLPSGAASEAVKRAAIIGRKGDDVDHWLGVRELNAPSLEELRPRSDTNELIRWLAAQALHGYAEMMLIKLGYVDGAGHA